MKKNLIIMTYLLFVGGCAEVPIDTWNPYDPLSDIYTPSAPVNLELSFTSNILSDARVKLRWDFEYDIHHDGYEIKRFNDNDKLLEEQYLVASDTTQFIDSKPIIPNVKYIYSVRAVKGNSRGAAVTDTIIHTLLQPVIMNIESTTYESAKFFFAHHGTLLPGFLIERSTDGINYSTHAILKIGEDSFTDSDLDTNKVYHYRISGKINDYITHPAYIRTIYTAYLADEFRIPYTPSINTIAINPAGSAIAFSGLTTRLVNATNGSLIYEFLDRSSHIAFSPNGQRLVIGEEEIHFREALSGEHLRTIPIPARYLSFTPDGFALISTTSYRTDAWDTHAYTRLWISYQENINSVKVHPSGQTVLRTAGRNIAELSLADGSIKREWETTQNVIFAEYNFNGTVFAAGLSAGIQVYDATTGDMGTSLTGYGQGLRSFAFTSRDYIITSYTQSPLVFYNPPYDHSYTQSFPWGQTITHIVVSSKADRVALVHHGMGVSVWNIVHGWRGVDN